MEWSKFVLNQLPNEVVYFISDGEFVKIGKTTGFPTARMKSLQTGNPRKLELIMIAYANNLSALNLESWLHGRYKGCHVRGEWYKLTVIDLICSSVKAETTTTAKNRWVQYLTGKPTTHITFVTDDRVNEWFSNKIDPKEVEKTNQLIIESKRITEETLQVLEESKRITEDFCRKRGLKMPKWGASITDLMKRKWSWERQQGSITDQQNTTSYH